MTGGIVVLLTWLAACCFVAWFLWVFKQEEKKALRIPPPDVIPKRPDGKIRPQRDYFRKLSKDLYVAHCIIDSAMEIRRDPDETIGAYVFRDDPDYWEWREAHKTGIKPMSASQGYVIMGGLVCDSITRKPYPRAKSVDINGCIGDHFNKQPESWKDLHGWYTDNFGVLRKRT